MIRTITCVTLLLVAIGTASAQQAPQPSAEEVAVRKAIASYVEAFNRGDAAAVAQHFAEKGSYLDPASGERLIGREAITKAFTAVFAGDAKPKLDVAIETIRFLDDKVAVEEGQAIVVSPNDAPAATSYLALHIKKDGKWLLESVRETSLPEPAVENDTPLNDLAWLVGRWVDSSDDTTIETDCDWTMDQTFLTRTFKVAVKGTSVVSGTQIIAWDPAGKQIRSWVFDSDGTFGEAEWTQDKNRWLIRSHNTLANGTKGTALQIITKVDDDRFTWQSVSRQVDGEVLPNIDPVTVVRQGSN